ncbi:MAG TPA: energy-coupling factor ABC transporter permease [Chloroflexia bacterium]|nr:energy-coupling factor ABC transporter permease [Chloroflexia bacterium]
MLVAPIAMHIPDGFLSVPVSIILWALAVGAIAYSLAFVSKELGERQVPLMGVLAAAIFAGQMLNFPVGGGTSGHLMGAALATILLGPRAAILVLTSVVSIQALLFQDGGLLALGGNIFNMGVVGVAVSYFVYKTVQRLAGNRRWAVLVGGFAAAWLSIFIASLGVGIQLAASDTAPANISIPAMAVVHAIIGIGEGLITVGALAFISATRPDLLKAGETRAASGGRLVWVAGLLMALALAVLSPIASSNPDGLEWVAEQNGFLGKAQSPQFNIIPDYTMPGIDSPALATILAGIIGTIIVFGVALAVAYTRRRRQPTTG